MPNLAIAGRWLRHKKNGIIYPYLEVLAKNPAVEEVPEEIAFPEKHIPQEQKDRKPELNLETDEGAVEEAVVEKLAAKKSGSKKSKSKPSGSVGKGSR